MKVTAVLKGRKDQNGQVPVQIRTADGKRRSFIPTRIRVSPAQFKNGKVTGHPNAAAYNADISRLIIITHVKALAGETGSKDVPFYTYALGLIDGWEKEKKDSTLKQLRSALKTFNSHAPNITLQAITPAFLNKYKQHRLKTVSANTAWSSFKFLRTIINQALREGTLKEDPFKGFKRPSYKVVRKVYLTEEELRAIETVLPGHPLAHYGWWFLIACYTGLRVGDLLKFNRHQHIVSGRLVLYTSKTDEVVSLPTVGRLDGYFKAVDFMALSCAEETYREKIKLIAAVAGITKPISTHTARHTFGVLCASKGLRQEVTAKLMGHSDLKSTATYYQLAGTVMDDEYARLFR